MKNLLAALLIAFAFFLPSKVSAQSIQPPQFPNCNVPPSAEIKANYQDGIHGIPGESGEYKGSDIVFQVTPDMVLQCFCPNDQSEGIQTNWWKVPNISDQDRNIFTKQGWVFVPNGKLWGLDESNYLARNIRYECNGVGGIGGANSDILGISTLAATGSTNLSLILGAVGIGISGIVLQLLKRGV